MHELLHIPIKTYTKFREQKFNDAFKKKSLILRQIKRNEAH